MGTIGFIVFVVIGFIILSKLFDPTIKRSLSGGLRSDGYYSHKDHDLKGSFYDIIAFSKTNWQAVLVLRYYLPLEQEEKQTVNELYRILNDFTRLRDTAALHTNYITKFTQFDKQVSFDYDLTSTIFLWITINNSQLPDYTPLADNIDYEKTKIKYKCNISDNVLIVDTFVDFVNEPSIDKRKRQDEWIYRQKEFRFTKNLITQ